MGGPVPPRPPQFRPPCQKCNIFIYKSKIIFKTIVQAKSFEISDITSGKDNYKYKLHKRSAFIDGSTNALGAEDWMNDIGGWSPEHDGGSFRMNNQNDRNGFRITTKRTPM